jgi:Asp-tRNA(Asn)/Glu-tRNA(Gln) amidotransferase A subunit family amidase
MTAARFIDWVGLEAEAARPAYGAAVPGVAAVLDERLALFSHRGSTDAELEWWAANRRREREEGREREGASPLAGLPYAVKDMLYLPGREAGCGLARPPGGLVEAPGDGGPAALLRRLALAGAERVGMTRMTALAYEPSGWNGSGPQPLNPWHPEHVTGGSSSGSGAAVASGAAVVAIGSDTGGSVRIPAACVGVTGWKPTAGLLPLDGALQLCPSLDTLGLLARHAGEITAVAEAILGGAAASDVGRRLLDKGNSREGRAPRAPGWPDARLVTPPARIMVLSDLVVAAEASVARAIGDGLDALEATGPRLERKEGRCALDVLDKPTLALLQGESARSHRALLQLPDLEAGLARRLEKGLALADDDLARHRRGRARLLRDFLEAFLPENTALALPVLAIRTPHRAECDPVSPAFSPRTLYALSALTRFANFLGLPALSLPLGPDDRGLPVGLQLVGRPGSDAALLAAGAALQGITDWHARVPPLVGPALAGTPLLAGAGDTGAAAR